MAAKRTAATEPTPETGADPEPQPAPAPASHASGWGHDWRNPDARFAADDHCVDAEFARQERREP